MMFTAMYIGGAAGVLVYFYLWGRDTAAKYYEQRERAAVEAALFYVGHHEGASDFWLGRPKQEPMSAEVVDSLAELAEDPTVGERWRQIHMFQLAKADGWRLAEEMDSESADVEEEFYAWQREHGEAA